MGLLARLSLVALHAKLDEAWNTTRRSPPSPADYASPKLTACAQRVAASAGLRARHLLRADRRALVDARGPGRPRGARASASPSSNAVETQGADRIRIAREVQRHHRRAARAGLLRQRTQPAGAAEVRRIIANPVAYEGVATCQVRSRCWVHHLDPTWTPRTSQQRNGGSRQGNEPVIVQIYYYPSGLIDGLVSLPP
ncbi:MAG: hypothetical protein IPN16_24330 [Gemmatimonadetes bacterium]|nr:hypothetical protein [Gemmatimonadota bacterium]